MEIAQFDLGGIEALAGHNLDGIAFPAVVGAVRDARAAGRDIVLTWHSVNPLTHGGPGDNRAPLSVASVLPGGRVHEKYVKWLGNAAMLIEQLTDASGAPIPIVFAPFPDHTADRFWWAVGDGSDGPDASADEFAALWRFTVEYLRDLSGLRNLAWAFAPGVPDAAGGDPEALALRGYPGDAYVDVFGIDDADAAPENAAPDSDGAASSGNAAAAREPAPEPAAEVIARLARAHGKPLVSLGSKRD